MTGHELSINTYCKYEISINRILTPVCIFGCFHLAQISASLRNTGHMYADNALKRKRESACASLHVVTVTHYRDNYGITTIYSYYSSALEVALVDLFARPFAAEPGTEHEF